MQQEFERKHFHDEQQMCRFFMLWLTIFLWGGFLTYMLLFHYLRDIVEPLVMSHFEVINHSYYQFAEIRLFTYWLLSCCIISILAIISTSGIKRRRGDNIPDKHLIVIMSLSVLFAFYYVKNDLDYFNGQLSILATLLGD